MMAIRELGSSEISVILAPLIFQRCSLKRGDVFSTRCFPSGRMTLLVFGFSRDFSLLFLVHRPQPRDAPVMLQQVGRVDELIDRAQMRRQLPDLLVRDRRADGADKALGLDD